MEPEIGDLAEVLQPATVYGASLESGMDNSPMYDEISLDTSNYLMCLSDVGLVSLYITDCEALAVMAGELGHVEVARELTDRARDYASGLKQLWNADAGIFQNCQTDTGEFSPRLSPTLFYPLLAGVASPEEAAFMVERHLLNEQEFWGEWVLPSISRNDPAFTDQVYWRGRIWAPLNFLVYLGLKRAKYDGPASMLAARSLKLLEKNWSQRWGMFENYSPITGEGGEVMLCDPLYPWSGLFFLMAAMDDNRLPLPSILAQCPKL